MTSRNSWSASCGHRDTRRLLEAARAELRPGLSREHAVIIGYSKLTGAPLDPFSFDDAAVILRAERLVVDGLGLADAVSTARAELVIWKAPA